MQDSPVHDARNDPFDLVEDLVDGLAAGPVVRVRWQARGFSLWGDHSHLSCSVWVGWCFRVGFFVGIVGVGWSFQGTKAAVGSGG